MNPLVYRTTHVRAINFSIALILPWQQTRNRGPRRSGHHCSHGKATACESALRELSIIRHDASSFFLSCVCVASRNLYPSPYPPLRKQSKACTSPPIPITPCIYNAFFGDRRNREGLHCSSTCYSWVDAHAPSIPTTYHALWSSRPHMKPTSQ